MGMQETLIKVVTLSEAELATMLEAAAERGAKKAMQSFSSFDVPGMITIQEAAKRYGKPVSTLREYIWRQKNGGQGIRYRKSGKTVYFCPAELEEDLVKIGD